jgi:hypothetical protein
MGKTGIQQQQQKEAKERANGLTENNISGTESGNEGAKRSLELPLFLSAGIAYSCSRLVDTHGKKDNKNSIFSNFNWIAIIDRALHFIAYCRFPINRIRTSRAVRLDCCDLAGGNSCLLWIYIELVAKGNCTEQRSSIA